MNARLCSLHALRALAPFIVLASVGAMGPAQAQYKIVGPDNKVTYTDRAPSNVDGRITALGGRSATTAADAELPYELRQIASRYPVTLYVSGSGCEPCEIGRALLRQRGIPYTEKLIATGEDSDALEKLSGGRDAPTLTIGAQIVRGFAADTWSSYLDAAGYPRDSKLPATYQHRAAAPIVERRAVATAPRAPARPSEEARPVERPPVTSGGIQF